MHIAWIPHTHPHTQTHTRTHAYTNTHKHTHAWVHPSSQAYGEDYLGVVSRKNTEFANRFVNDIDADTHTHNDTQ